MKLKSPLKNRKMRRRAQINLATRKRKMQKLMKRMMRARIRLLKIRKQINNLNGR